MHMELKKNNKFTVNDLKQNLRNYTPETYINLYDFNNMDFSVFKGGWSYMAQEMQNAVSLLPQQKNLSVL